MTLPIFPEFKKLELSDRKVIDSLTLKTKPYSDFNFTNLWAWDTLTARKIALLNENLVVYFTDYRDTKPFLSFIGDNLPEKTATSLIEYAEKNNLPTTLRFITEEIADKLYDSSLVVEEDQENSDYIFSTKQLAESTESKLKIKRRLARNFIRDNHEVKVQIDDFSDKVVHEQILEVLYCWRDNKKSSDKPSDIKHEEIALRRLFDSCGNHNLILTSLYLHNKMIGFSIDEILDNNYAISHFIKADIKYRGIYEFINEQVAEHLLTNGSLLWNWEQDLNIEGLRQLKNSYQPVAFLKKYRISRKG